MIRFATGLGLVVAVVTSPVHTAAQSFRHVRGEVRSLSSGTIVPFAFVRSTGGATTRADAKGVFVLSVLVASDTLRIRAPGFRELTHVLSPDAQSLVLHLQPAPVVLDDIVVTGSRRLQRASETTVSLQVIDAREIATTGSSRVNDILVDQPGLQITPGQPTGENIMIRGIGDSRVLVLIDGEPATGALIENRDLSRLSTLAVERIEVVKGPMSVVYGSDALGGVINIITADTPGGAHQEFEGRVGENGRAEFGGSVAGGNTVRYRVSGGLRRQEWTPGISDTDGTLARLWDVRATVRADISSNSTMRADANFIRERQRWPVNTSFNGFNDNWGLTTWAEGTTRGATGDWSLRAFYQTYEHLYRQSRGAIPIADSGAPVQREQFIKTRLQWNRPFGDHHVDAGVEVGTREIESPDKILNDRASDTQFEAYTQDTWTYKRLVGTIGGRLTDNDRWGQSVTPSVGLAWEVTDRVRVRGTVGRGFRGPSFKELAWNFANPQAGYTVLGNPDLQPERSWHTSFEFNWSPFDRLRLTVEGFRNDIDNLIEDEFVGNTPAGLLIFSPRNVSTARTQGVELGLRWEGNGYNVTADYTYLDARDLAVDLPLNRRSNHMARVRGQRTWIMGSQAFTFTTSARYTGTAPLVGTSDGGAPALLGQQDRLVTLDGQVRISVVDGSLDFELGVDNAFNMQPSGWPSALQRRVYAGVTARR